MTAPGTPTTYFIIRFDKKRLMRDGRKLSFPAYYQSKNKDVPAPYQAVMLNEETAKQVVSLYPEKNMKIIQESGYLNDDDHVYSTLAEVGESVTASEFESTVRAALRSLSKSEVKDIFKRVLA